MDGPRHKQYEFPTHSLQVPLLSAAGGDPCTGYIRVPRSLATASPHTTAHRKLSKLIVEGVDKWAAWNDARDWVLDRKSVQVLRPVDEPTASADEETDPDFVRIYFKAKRTRKFALRMPADLFEHKAQQAARYGVDLESGADLYVPTTSEHDDETPEERRTRLGIEATPVVKDGEVVHNDLVYKPLPDITPGTRTGNRKDS